jgi:uncharacterized repeat protein (TIGR01451 family)
MRTLVNHVLAGLISLAALLSSGLPMDARAQTISNIASLQWDAGSSRVGRQSNRVDIQVDRSVQLPPATLSTFQLTNAPGGQSLAVGPTQCHGSSGINPVTLGGVFEGTSLSPASVRPSSQIRAGEPLIISLSSPGDNLSATAIDTISVNLETPGSAGDREALTLSESGANTGVFVGMIRTAAIPPTPIRGDCVLSVHPGEALLLSGLRSSDNSAIATAPVDVLIDPFGIVFDSGDGAPIAGAVVTLIDVGTGQPAQVFGDDGLSSFPSTVTTGSTVTDSGGNRYVFPPGDYRFPFVRAGNYRLVVQPPAPYSTPSLSSPAALAGLLRPDGIPYTIVDGSYGRVFTLNSPSPVRIDIPADKPGGALIIRKSASSAVAVPGDAVQYRVVVQNSDPARTTGLITVEDIFPREMRLRKNTVRYNGIITSYTVTPDGRNLSVPLPALGGGASGVLTYILEVRPDARPGQSLNRAKAFDNRGAKSAIADAVVRIARDAISERMTIIGRITDGGCTVDPSAANGIPNVRVMLEDGSYAVTDVEGRYHFEGVLPGLHVVQMDASTLPSDQVPVDCLENARSGGSAISRFVDGRGGALIRVDFRSVTGKNASRLGGEVVRRTAAASDAEAAGANIDWFTGQTPGIGWLFPGTDHNPRTKAVRVTIKHWPEQIVILLANGKVVEPLTFEGTRKNGDGSIAVSLWRAVPIGDGDTIFTAEVRDPNGTLVQTLTHKLHYANSALRAEFIREKSILVADGVTRPVIAVRMLDRDNMPVHHGLVGDFSVPAPYFPAVEADAQAAKQLAGLERGKPVWRVEGDDGIAYIELEPTTASGNLSLTLPFRDRDTARSQRIETWLTPGKRPWTIVGFAAGTVGFNKLDARLEKLGENGEHWYSDARIALYAKGRVKGKWLMTLAYDSDKQADDTRFAGTIDPTAYYTIYADRSERRYDAASVRKLYLKLERPQFYALFGDYETGINEPVLTRYQRAFNGVKAEFGNEQVRATAFAADTPYRHRREEIQGNGLSGPYALGARDIFPNSERVVIEVRDRLRSNRIIESRALIRNIDYDIDYLGGTLRFREPILSRSSSLDPQFIVVDYEVDGVAQRVLNAGGRAAWTNKAKTLAVAATAIHDEDDRAKTNVGGVDIRYTPSANTEVRAEIAISDTKPLAGSTTTATGGSATAWLVEAEHHGSKYDVLAYAREQEAGYGIGQTNNAENGTRKYGVDGRVRLNTALSIVGNVWQEDALGSDARRQAGRALAEYRAKALDLRAGLTIATDRLADGKTGSSTIAQFGATKRLFEGKLELDAQTEIPLGGKDESVDFPARHKLSARVAITPNVALIGAYEIAKGENIDARTARIGFDVKPWTGGRVLASANQQNSNEYGPRSFAAYGLSQSLPINEKLSVDFSLDGNKTLGGIDRSKVLNEAQPVSSGGFLGSDGTITEDFTAVTAGANWRGKIWAAAARAEYRNGEKDNRYGFTLAALRQIGEGRAFGGAVSWFRAKQVGGTSTETANLALSWANRPDDSRFALLDKFELRFDKVKGAVFGQSGPIGGAPLTVSGDVQSKRIINSFSLNWSPVQKAEDGRYLGRSEISAFWGARYVFDKFDADTLKGLSNVFGADIRFDLGKTLDLGFSGTLRQNPGGRAMAYSGGPTIGISPIKNSYISLGYNVVGFADRDFEDARYTRSGPFVTLRLKFDQSTLAGMGLGRRR